MAVPFNFLGANVAASLSAGGALPVASSLGSFVLPFALFGGALSIIGANRQNKAIEEAARKQQLMEEFRAADRKMAVGFEANRNVGAITASSADRNAFGQSAKAVALNEIARGLVSESLIDRDKYTNILSIANRANASKANYLDAFVGGASSGLGLGLNVRGLF